MEHVFELLRNVSLLAKTVSADPEHVDFVLNQLEDPENFRPLKKLAYGHDRAMYHDPRSDLNQWQMRFFSRPREHHIIWRGNGKITRFGHPKDTLYTKKTSVTLLPPHAKIKFYQPAHKNAVGFLLDINACNLKNEKYIFSHMSNTDERWWIYHPQKTHLIQKSISLKTLQIQLIDSASRDQMLHPNELLVGLSLNALVGIFSPSDTRESRFLSLIIKQKIRKKFNRDLPIFIINQNGIRIYSERRQKEDILESKLLNDPLFSEFKIYADPLFFDEKLSSAFPLEQLYKRDFWVTYHIPSFLSLSELALLSQTNKAMRFLLNGRDGVFLWRDALSKKIIMEYKLNNKHDLGLYYEKACVAPGESLEVFARRNPQYAYRIMQSQFFSKQLPSAQRRQSNFRSNPKKIIDGLLGFFVGFGIGLVMTAFFMIQSLFRVIGFLFVIGTCYFRTSLTRSLLGATVFPFLSLGKSFWYGAMFGWKYGLRELSCLKDGLLMFHTELYCGTFSSDHDPWSCLVPDEETIAYDSNTDLSKIFEKNYRLKTIAEIAIDVHAQKPESLMYQAPYVEQSLSR